VNELVSHIRRRLPEEPPWVIGIGGPVAVGKTTIATGLAEQLSAQLLSTDVFLLNNDALAQRDLSMRKGFPESYDADAITDAFTRLRRGERIDVPVYSHEIYDIVQDASDAVSGGAIIVEGIVALQEPVRRFLDVAVYVDAPEEIVRGWFITRFLRWTEEAKDEPSSFYAGFASLERDAVRGIAEMTWDAINGVNLREHIAPSKAEADIVVEKDADHRVVRITSIDP
jgi:type I pantothenate kinase